jgi:aryl-alcohol dehydrogenase-like predicted oxidoreductase
MYYSLIGRDLEHDIVPFCLDAGVGVMAWSPLAGGFLSGKYTREQPKGGSADRLGGLDFLPYDRERGFAIVDLLRSIGKAHDASPAQVALAWLLTRPAVAAVLVGASSVSQLDENLGAATLALTADELGSLDAATKPQAQYPNWFTERVADATAYEALGLPADNALRR